MPNVNETNENNNSKEVPADQEEKMENTDKEEDANTVLDGGWGWMVAIGCFVITTLIPMVGPCFGILFSRYLLDQGTSSTMTAWIFNSQCFIWNIMGLVTRPLTQEFGWRVIGVLGALLTAISLAVSAFAPSAEFLFFSFSLLSGTGGGAVTCICFTILPHYFSRRRGVANAMMMAGVCMGQIVAPPLVQFLQDEYGFQGATLIIGAIILNGCIGASFFHPVEWHSKKVTDSNKLSKDAQEGDVPLLKRKENSKFDLNGDLKKSQSARSFGLETASKEIDWVEVISHARRLRMRDGRHSSDVSRLSVSSSLAVSTVDIAGVGAGYAVDEDGKSTAEDKNENKSVWKLLVRVANSTLSDLRVLRSPRALIISLGATLTINGYINYIMMVPFKMQVAGQTLESSAWCISVSAICNLFMRLLVSSMSDWPRFNVKACYVSGFVVLLISTLIFPFLTDLRWMLVIMGLWGCGVGASMGVYNLVMIAVMGLDNLAPVFGASCFMVALGFITFGPLIGLVRDYSQSYSISMWMVSAMVFTAIILWLFMPVAQAYDRKKERKNSSKELTVP